MARLWGGHRLKSWFGVDDPAPIGEYWVLSGHPNGVSVAENGPLAGMTLLMLTEQYPEAFLGHSPQNRFPLLIKFLEAQQDLSVQIHPDDAYAQAHEGDFGKTEAWYVLDCPPDGRVNYGHRFPSREAYFAAVREGRVRDYLEYVPIRPGQVVFVPSRTLHALLAGTMVIEVQQTSDVTYRVYDWDRVDEHGRPRALHVDKAAEVMDFGDEERRRRGEQAALPVPQTLFAAPGVVHERLVACPYFTMERLRLDKGGHRLTRGRDGNPDIVIVAEGEVTLAWPDGALALRRGDTVLVPATLAGYEVRSAGASVMLRAFY
ncbi:type I phosphomannose isomerase catalytic subunit [Alicyclobacillus cellulosilyticus]|nr:type I phosphomannose isomerase catalytic subunit [Alicyclobacillus cellulosilyticus]